MLSKGGPESIIFPNSCWVLTYRIHVFWLTSSSEPRSTDSIITNSWIYKWIENQTNRINNRSFFTHFEPEIYFDKLCNFQYLLCPLSLSPSFFPLSHFQHSLKLVDRQNALGHWANPFLSFLLTVSQFFAISSSHCFKARRSAPTPMYASRRVKSISAVTNSRR